MPWKMRPGKIMKKRDMDSPMPDKGQKTILLVEDEVMIAMAEKKTLERYGYKVITAMTGESAVEIMGTAPEIDLILMDINLGSGIEGTEAAEKILQHHDLPLIFLSSHTEPEVVDKTEGISSYGYIVKASGDTVLIASIKMAFKLFEARVKERMTDKDLQASEMRYRRLFESAKDGILILDAMTAQIVDVNPFLIEMLGYSYEGFIGKKIWEIGTFRDILASKASFAELQHKEYIRYDDLPLESADGRVLHVEFVSNVYLADNSKVIQCNIRDISERKEKDDKINDLLNEKDLILKEAHHRVKNHMSVIISLLSLQADAQDNTAAKAILEDAVGRVQRMMVLYEKLDRSKNLHELSIKDFLTSLIHEIVALFCAIPPIKMDIRIKDFLVNEKILSTIGIIVNELITNSMKYAFTGADNDCITLSASKKGRAVTIIYGDNGIGPQESTTLKHSTSFGIQLIRMLVQHMKGSLVIARRKGAQYVIEFDE